MTEHDFSSVRALIFDLDGTLIDSKLDLVHSVNAMLREMGRAELPVDTIAGYVGQGAPILVTRALGGVCSEEELQRGLKFFLDYYEQHKIDHTHVYPGIREALQAMQDAHMAVLTNKPVRISKRILDELDLSKYFRVVYGGNSFATKKPDPLGANVILKELGVARSEGMMIGDSEVDVQTARNAGIIAACVNYGFGTHDRAAYPADIYLDYLTELPPLLNGRAAAETGLAPGTK
jgi:phosphoglycolate phosphatase